ncbi:hypothetical protein P170DRAFT_357405 [Aspergillus steynii IBT 23096]|uniref:VWFA domain-containing protein n=1 Tax=Aspergillus steynii IBT 23096 TaxID=1392250 RepID=A0A2I2G7N5_9EURO|nr:uncharacterized protein P170DRAFT_357405 [Aspergillus steynii IBT 23096]PLB48885.1 hypothetical protein P170DRAFT_357405 [Aspergillus steynii IBT 23096]
MGHRHSKPSRSPRVESRNQRGLAKQPRSSTKSYQSPGARDLWSPPPYESHAPQASRTAAATVPTDDSAYSFLSEFDTIFVVDDSGSMSGRRWKEAEDAIAAIAPICTRYDEDGIDIYFLNHRREATRATGGAYTNITTADDVREIFNSVHPWGATPFGKRLHDILGPYLRRVEGMDPMGTVKPLNIIAITDGAFTDDAESIIVDVAKRLDACRAVPWQVGVQFFQIGDDAAARAYLQDLDDELGKRAQQDHLRDMVDTVPWKGKYGQTLSAEGILKCVLGAVNRKYDKSDNVR